MHVYTVVPRSLNRIKVNGHKKHYKKVGACVSLLQTYIQMTINFLTTVEIQVITVFILLYNIRLNMLNYTCKPWQNSVRLRKFKCKILD